MFSLFSLQRTNDVNIDSEVTIVSNPHTDHLTNDLMGHLAR